MGTLTSPNNDIADGFKKAVGVVQVAMGKLGFLHRKTYNVLLANAYEGLAAGERRFQMKASMMAEVLDFNSHNMQEIYDHCRDIQTTEVLTINFDQGRRGKNSKIRSKGGTSLISEFDVFPHTGVIEYGFSDKMAHLLGDPDSYIWMTLTQQNRFSSKYELALFENALRYIGVGSTGFKDVENWRALLGAEDKTYDVFKDLNKKVLKPAIKGINEKSGILIKPEFEREKRRVARIRFSVQENPQQSLLEYQQHNQMRESAAYQAARRLGLKEVQAFFWLENKGEQAVAEAAAYVESRPKIKNKAGYLVKALQEGFGEKSPEEREKEAAAAKQAAEREQRQTQQAQTEAEAQAVQTNFARYKRTRGKATIKKLSAPQRAELKTLVRQGLPGVMRSIIRRFDELDGEYEQFGALKTDAVILNEFHTEALKKWGKPREWDVQAYCDWKKVAPQVRQLIK